MKKGGKIFPQDNIPLFERGGQVSSTQRNLVWGYSAKKSGEGGDFGKNPPPKKLAN